MCRPTARLALLPALLMLLFAATARAQPISGFYVGGGGGFDLPQNTAATPPAPGFGTGRLRLERDGGYAVLGSAGYALGDGWRFEIEADDSANGMRALARTPAPATISGHSRSFGAMANALFDMDIGSRYIFPYLGVGAGYLWTRLDGVSIAETGGAAWHSSDTQGSFAWQAMLGSAFPVPGMPGLSVTAEYRFRDITAGERFVGSSPPGSAFKLGPQYQHLFLLGIRYAFDVPPPSYLSHPAATPAPVAAPAPAPARSYLVFFDWDSAALTARARAIVAEAADASRHVQVTRIMVNGYTDASGGAAYNRALSERRAHAVGAELVRDGVAAKAIAIRGFGETHPLVPTAPGAREPQNRRVEIILR
ncbi:MAG: OmpA family protein [Rhodospirillales bacterium]|nr:OmpA family protein [Rhodospirillales bacterium]